MTELRRRRRKLAEEEPEKSSHPYFPERPPGTDPEILRVDLILKNYRDRIKNPLTAIRSFCVECQGGAVEGVNNCQTTWCSLHPFRGGKNVMSQRYGKSNPTANFRRRRRTNNEDTEL